MDRSRRLKLQPELAPQPLWGISAYRLLGRGARWKQIRQDTLEAAGHCCSVCGATTPPLSCHEKWDYNDKNTTATLIGFMILCAACDAATHMGRAVKHGQSDIALKQLCRVNGITLAEAKQLFMKAMTAWQERSRKEWRATVARFPLKRYPQLKVVMNSTK
jgi:hypothetical protein